MNHTERVFYVARQVRGLTREMAREAVEGYLASVAEELAEGELITIPGIGRLQIVARQNGGRLLARLGSGQKGYRRPGMSLQARLRLDDHLKAQCRTRLHTNPGLTRNNPGDQIDNPEITRDYPGNGTDNPGLTRNKPGKE